MEIASASGKVQLLAQSSGEHDDADSDATSTIGPKNKVFFIFYKRKSRKCRVQQWHYFPSSWKLKHHVSMLIKATALRRIIQTFGFGRIFILI